MTSTLVWFLLLLSSVFSYYAHHLVDDQTTPDSERNERHPETTSAAGQSMEMGERAPLTSEHSSTSAVEHPRTGRIRTPFIARVANWLRWIGKFLAIVNAIGVVTNSIFQFVGVYDNCYCDSSVYRWGSAAFNVIMPTQGDISLAQSAWGGALALGLTCCAFFVGTIYVIRDSLPS